ncbi:MAG TPA: crosslink repair DNA glycosylase YcaQ family protein [Ohtaekwangia sp.]|uniref:winged helix-turn-helix domain-containing protein n=1 Tax=Ohtaekwangia sp. TaxID=2066019 RepID=UPI002F926C54
MNSVTLTPSQARKIILHAVGLSKRGQFGKGKEAVFKVIDHLGFVQIDTNYIVERAHHHALAARIPDYKPEWLEELEADGRIFEFWTFAAGYIPINDFRYSLPVKASFVARRPALTQTEINLMRRVLDRIGREGPLMARDFENDRVTKSSGWWDWRPSKVALERLYLDGSLITTRKKNFQKVYDLTENILPSDLDITMPTDEEFARHVIKRSLQTLGIASLKEIAFSARYVEHSIKTVMQTLVDAGEVCTVTVEGLKTSPLYMLPLYKKKKITLSDDAFILSPFDILNVFRFRLRDFFNFDYQVECFVPKAKRKYGYFSLPILIGDTFVARMDSKAERKQRTLIIHNLHVEKVKFTKVMIDKMCDAIERFAKFNNCETIVLEKCNDKALMKSIREALS